MHHVKHLAAVSAGLILASSLTVAHADSLSQYTPPDSAIDFGVNEDINPLIPHLDSIQPSAVTELPIKGMVAMEVDGDILFISKDGRYALQGRAHDLWYDLPLSDMANIETSATTLRLAGMGIDSRQLSSLTLGDETADVEQVHTVFIDPRSEHSLAYVDAVSQLENDAYSAVSFVLVPAFGDESASLIEHFTCRDDSVTDADALTALLDQTINTLPRLDSDDCDLSPSLSAMLIAEQIGVNGVPFTATASGDVIRGIPDNISAAFQSGFHQR